MIEIDKSPVARVGDKPPVEKNLARFILRVKRQFYIEMKEMFRNAIIAYANSLPEPVIGEPQNDKEKQATWVNSPVFMRIRDKFMGYCRMEEPEHAAAWKIFIDELEHDPDHRATMMFLFEEVTEAIINGEIEPRDWVYPSERLWLEPRETKGYWKGRQFAQFIKGGDK